MPNYEPVCVGTKVCRRCQEEKHVLAFQGDKQNSDGISSYCRGCAMEVSKSAPSRRRQKREAAKRKVRRARLSNPLYEILTSRDYGVD